MNLKLLSMLGSSSTPPPTLRHGESAPDAMPCSGGETTSAMSSLASTDLAVDILDLSPLMMVGNSHNALVCYDPICSDGICLTSESSNLHVHFMHSDGDFYVGLGAWHGSAFPLGSSNEPKLQEQIRKGLFVLFDIILLSEQWASVDHHLRNLSVAPTFDSRTHALMAAMSDLYGYLDCSSSS